MDIILLIHYRDKLALEESYPLQFGLNSPKKIQLWFCHFKHPFGKTNKSINLCDTIYRLTSYGFYWCIITHRSHIALFYNVMMWLSSLNLTVLGFHCFNSIVNLSLLTLYGVEKIHLICQTLLIEQYHKLPWEYLFEF